MGGAQSRGYVAAAHEKAAAARASESGRVQWAGDTEMTRELDELGGAQRKALGRRESFDARLDWLADRVGEQSNAMEAALMKDPNAGRKELQRQQRNRDIMSKRKGVTLDYAAQNRADAARLWKHRLESANGTSPKAASGAEPARASASGAQPPAPARASASGAQPPAPARASASGAQPQPPGRASASGAGPGANGRQLNASPYGASIVRQAEQAVAREARLEKTYGNSFKRPASADPSQWRLHIAKAKQTAVNYVASIMAMSAGRPKASRHGPQRVNSFSFFVDQSLDAGKEVKHLFTAEQETLAWSRERTADLQAELEELRAALRPPDEASGSDEDEVSELLAPPPVKMRSGPHGSGVGAADGAPPSPSPPSKPRHRQSAPGQLSPDKGGPTDGAVVISPRSARLSKQQLSKERVGTEAAAPPTLSSPAQRSTSPTTGRRSVTGAPSSPQAPVAPRNRLMSASGQLTPSPPTQRLSTSGSQNGRRINRNSSVKESMSDVPDYKPGTIATKLLSPRSMRSQTSQSRPQLLATLSAKQRQEEETANVMRQKEIVEELEALAKAIKRGEEMLTMYAHKANGAWLEECVLGLPHVYDSAKAGGAVAMYRDQVQQYLRAGKLCIQVLADDDELELESSAKPKDGAKSKAPGAKASESGQPPAQQQQQQPAEGEEGSEQAQGEGKEGEQPQGEAQEEAEAEAGPSSQRHSLWATDPWALLSDAFPSKAEAVTTRIDGLPLGVRSLLGLAAYITEHAGPEGLANTVVVLNIREGQVEAVRSSLLERKLCGFAPQNLLVTVQPAESCVGYTWDAQQQLFARDPASQPAGMGSGYSLMQMTWQKEAWCLGGPKNDQLTQLPGSVLDFLSSKGVQWMLLSRLRDLSSYDPGALMDMDQLAYGMYLHDHGGANMILQVEQAASLQAARRLGSGLVLALKGRVAPKKADPNLRMPLLSQSGTAPAGGSNRLGGGGRARPSTAPAHSMQGAAMAARAAARMKQASNRQRFQGLNGSAAAAAGGAGAGAPGPRANGFGALQYLVGQVAAQKQQQQGGGGTANGRPSGPLPVIDVKMSDAQTPWLAEQLQKLLSEGGKDGKDAKGGKGGQKPLTISTKRTLMHVPTLKSAVTSISVFRAALDFKGNHVYVSFDAADLTNHPAVKCLAVTNSAPRPHGHGHGGSGGSFSGGAGAGRTSASGSQQQAGPRTSKLLQGAADLDDLLAAVTAQDGNKAFRDIVGKTNTASSKAISHTAAASDKPRQKIVLLVADNDATVLAAKLLMPLLKPGLDMLHLVTVVSDRGALPAGSALLTKIEALLAPTLVEMRPEVLVKRSSVVEDLQVYVSTQAPGLVVAGSQALLAPSTSAGSVAMALLKEMTVPMLLVKANASNSAIAAWDKDKMRAGVAVDHNARPCLKYVTSRLLKAERGDKVFLLRGGGVDSAGVESMSCRRLIDSFEGVALSARFGSTQCVRRPLEDALEVGAPKLADQEKIHLLAIQAPAGRGPLPAPLVAMIKAAKSAVLFYKSSESNW